MRIALISDIHFGKFSRTAEFTVPGELVRDEVEGAVSLENGLIDLLNKQGVNYLFIAGDLTSSGSPQEYYYCEEKILNIANKSGIAKDNIICSLGNHDIDWKVFGLHQEHMKTGDDKTIEIIKKQYKRLSSFTPYINLDVLGKYTNSLPFPNVYVYDNSTEFIVFVLNTSWDCCPDQKVSHGCLSQVQIDWFEKNAERYLDDDRYKIVLMHHHLIPFSYPTPIPDLSQIEEADKFMGIASKYKIDLILHGHRHHPAVRTTMENGWAAPITVICAGSLSVNFSHRNGCPNTLHIIDIDRKKNGRCIDLYNYQYSDVEGWKPIEYSLKAALDFEMHLGKLITRQDLEKMVDTCIQEKKHWKWTELPEGLRFLTIKDVYDCFEKKARDLGLLVFGKFTESNGIFLHSKKELNQ